jgi:dipeptidase D
LQSQSYTTLVYNDATLFLKNQNCDYITNKKGYFWKYFKKSMDMQEYNSKIIMDIFNQICMIPHPSGHEERMGVFLKEFGEKRGLKVKTDEVGNVLISKPASNNYENRNTVILQAHQDMVCEKDASIEHDFMTQAIDTYIDNGWLMARGTTLGADDGIGMAMALAILDNNDIKHGPIECLFTVSEETGLTGAQNLKSDMLNGSMLINLDSEDEGEIYIGCAGGMNTTVTFEYEKESVPADFFCIKIGLDKLHGGHSGDDIDKGYANANKLLVRFLNTVMDKYDVRLCSIKGGNLHNAIPRDASVVIAIPNKYKESIRVDFNIFAATVQEEYNVTESNTEFIMESTDFIQECIERKVAKKIIMSIAAAFNGVFAMSMDVPGLVETSSNLASIRTNSNSTVIVASHRSSVSSSIKDVKETFAAAFRLAGAKVEHNDGYPGWTPNPKSQLLAIAVETYKDLFGKDPKVKAIHAGLECGLFLKSYPNLDMISIGPTLRGVHSPSERLDLSTVPLVFNHLIAILKQIPEKS